MPKGIYVRKTKTETAETAAPTKVKRTWKRGASKVASQKSTTETVSAKTVLSGSKEGFTLLVSYLSSLMSARLGFGNVQVSPTANNAVTALEDEITATIHQLGEQRTALYGQGNHVTPQVSIIPQIQQQVAPSPVLPTPVSA